jgi:hypothetical protein
VSKACTPCRRGPSAGNAVGTVAPVVLFDPDHVQGGRSVHDAIVKGRRVNPPHRDQVTAGLARAGVRQEPQFPSGIVPAGRITRIR